MMKRKILAVIVPALLTAGAANAAEIYNKDGNKLDFYGKIQGSHYFTGGDGDDLGQNGDGDKTYVRFGVKGETQVNDQVIGYGNFQTELKANKEEGDNSLKTRLAYAGIKVGDAGSFDYGRNYGILYDIGGWTDVLPEFGGDAYEQTDIFMTQRAGGLATYRNKGFFGLVDGLNIAAQYQAKNERERGDFDKASGSYTAAEKQNGDGYGLSATYDLGMGLSLGAAYASSNRTNNQNTWWVGTSNGVGVLQDSTGDKADAATFGIKYDANNIYLAAQYAQTYNMNPMGNTAFVANKTQNIELVAQYQFDFGLQPSLGYVQSKGKDLNTYTLNSNGTSYSKYDSQDLVKYIDVGASYFFNKNISTFVDYKINLIDDNRFTKAVGITSDNTVAVGIVYQF